MELRTRSSWICRGSGSWTRIPWIRGSWLKRRMRSRSLGSGGSAGSLSVTEWNPISSHPFPFIATDDWDAGLSPTRIKASPGVIPREVFSLSVSSLTSRLMSAAIALPSISFAGTRSERRVGEALELEGLSGGGVGLDVRPAQADVVGGKLVLVGGLMEEPLDRNFFLESDHRVVRPGHPHVGDVGGAAGKDPRVRRPDVGVGPQERGDPAVEMPSERHLFRGRLRVHVEHDHGRLLAHLADGPVGLLERAVERLHVDASLHVQHPGLSLLAEVVHDEAVAGILGRVIERTKDVAVDGEKLSRTPVVPEMVSARDHVHADAEDALGVLLVDPLPLHEVLAVRDDEVDLVLLDVALDQRFGEIESGLADDIADEKYIQDFLRHGGRQNILKFELTRNFNIF